MENTRLLHLSSISKKLIVALLGGFLLFFLLFHMVANLCILRNDGGEWYSAFCHFMTNPFVKVMEIVLMACLIFHCVLTIYLWFSNRKARPVRYHQPSSTKTAMGSKLTIITGILIICFLALHFCNFYFVKLGLIEGSYMVKTEKIEKSMGALGDSPKIQNAMALLQMTDIQSEDDVFALRDELAAKSSLSLEESDLLDYLNLEKVLMDMSQDGRLAEGIEYVRQMSSEEKHAFEAMLGDTDIEPDFYYMARDLFANPLYSIIYLLCFIVLWVHMRHAFEAAFQTLGLNNYKYNRAIELIGIAYATLICFGFAIVPICVLFL